MSFLVANGSGSGGVSPPPTGPNALVYAGRAAHQFFVIQELLGHPELARFYTDLLINSPTTITAARERQGFSKSTAYKYANTLAELGVAAEREEYEEGVRTLGRRPRER